jgi:hypothetical protein
MIINVCFSLILPMFIVAPISLNVHLDSSFEKKTPLMIIIMTFKLIIRKIPCQNNFCAVKIVPRDRKMPLKAKGFSRLFRKIQIGSIFFK